MDDEKLFLSTLDDIEEKIKKGDAYSITRAAGLLRHLLLDGEPLVHAVNRKHRLKVEFETIDFTFKIPIRPHIHWQNLDPTELNPGALRITVDLQSFLAAEVLVYDQHDFTVKDILKAVAHIKGGVHSGKAKNDKEAAMLKLDELISIKELDASTAALKGILSVAVNGLQPLANTIRSVHAR